MRDARFTIPTPALLAKVVDLIGDLPMEGRDTKGAAGDAVLLGDGTYVSVTNRYVRLPVSAAADEMTRAHELSVLRLATGAPPTLLPAARAGLATSLEARDASPAATGDSLGPYLLFGAR